MGGLHLELHANGGAVAGEQMNAAAAVALGDLLQYHASRKPPDDLALIYPDSALTWRELDIRANRRARLYRALGVRKDDLVAVALPNSSAFHEVVFALWKLGATPTILSPRLPRHEFMAIVRLVSPRLVIGSSLEGCDDAFCCVGVDADVSQYEASVLPSETPTYWKAMCSGGSTGRPKVIVDHMTGAFDPSASQMQALYEFPVDGVVLNPGPLSHNGPFIFSSMALFTGSKLIGMTRFDAEETLRLIERHRVNWVCLVPTMMHRIWSLPREVRERYDLSSLRAVWHMAAACPEWLKQAWIGWLGAERIWERYAGTERFGGTRIRGDEWLLRRGSVGRIVGDARIKAVNEAGLECAPGEIGELFFLPPGGVSPSHYLGAQAKRDAAGWFSIGDLGWLDGEGFVYLADRRTDLILRGGANIYPAEIEAALDQHSAVASSLAIGLPCQELGARIHALIEPRAGCTLDLDEIRRFLATRLAKYKLPESYEVTSQPLRDDGGKARRTALRDERVRWLQEGRSFKASLP